MSFAHPTEFKEIRKEWKQKKKEEENQRKQEEERQRQEAARNGQDPNQQQGTPTQYGQPAGMMPHPAQLPPIGYQPAAGQPPAHYAPGQQVDGGAPQYPAAGNQMYAQSYPQSPYAQGGLPYQQRK